MKVVTAAQMQALDRRAITDGGVPSLSLMENAGSAVVAAMERTFGPVRGKAIAILCGKGNNGGDGFVVARLLKRRGARVVVFTMVPARELRGDPATMYRRFSAVGGKTAVKVCPSAERLQNTLQDSDLIVDALFGTGLSAAITGPYRTAIETLNRAGRPVIAVDLPSGIEADTGTVLGVTVRATLTVTFGLPKLGLYLKAGIDHAGKVVVADIGIPRRFVEEISSTISLITHEDAVSALPRRLPSSHKGTYGHAAIIAGSVGKTGAAALAARGALRVGAGLVTVATPSSVNDTLEAKLLEAMTLPMPETKARTMARISLDPLLAFINARTAVAIGPGLSTHPETVELIQALVPRLEKPAVLDADALNALAGRSAILSECKIPPILTPHPGEMARLEDHATPQSINEDRLGTATRFAVQRRAIVVLKGARTILANPDGQVAICPTGNPGMATGGTGDVLTGMIVGLLAQRLHSWDAARAATFFHGLAGDLAAAERGMAGMTAGDLVERIPQAMAATS
jgi:ADP-dependent NAD(P)H-hydrate dehydratase / NAD(P)H-hydrate epimerase